MCGNVRIRPVYKGFLVRFIPGYSSSEWYIPCYSCPELSHPWALDRGIAGTVRKVRMCDLYSFDQRNTPLHFLVILVQHCFLWRVSLSF